MSATRSRTVLITARSFGRNDPGHMETLRRKGFKIYEFREGENADAEEIRRVLPEVDAWVVSVYPITREILGLCSSMKLIVKHGVGVDNIDIEAATAAGVPVANAPGSNHVAVADLAMTHLLAFTRKLIDAHHSVLNGKWERFLGSGVQGKTMGIIGVGRIGRAIAERCHGFGMSCVGYDPYQSHESFAEAGIQRTEELHELLTAADFISMNLPLSSETQGIIDQDSIAHMKPGVVIINTSRGKIADEAAVCKALHEGRIAGYATDVYENEPPGADSPLLRAPNVQFTPHVASYTVDSMKSLGDNVLEGIFDAFEGRVPENILNPELLEKGGVLS